MTDESWTEARFRGHLNETRKQLAFRAERALFALYSYKVPDDLRCHYEVLKSLKSIKTMATEMLEKLNEQSTD